MDEKLNILVVDDSRTVRASICKYLKEQFNIIEAEDGEAGWSALSDHPSIHLVISDIDMPRLDGYGFICRVRSTTEQSIRDTPIIVLTSAEDDASRTRAYACGANDFLLKPLDIADLRLRLQFQIEAGRNGQTHIGAHMQQYALAIDDAVLERPDVGQALRALESEEFGAIDPYLIELCLDLMPLLEHANRVCALGIDPQLSAIKEKLKW